MSKNMAIPVPDILPNNLKHIKNMRNKTSDNIAEATGLKNSYISILEHNKTNMSGISAISLMNYLDVNFYQLFGFEEPQVLPYTTEKLKVIKLETLIDANILKNEEDNLYLIDEIISSELKKTYKFTQEEGIKEYKISNKIPTDNKDKFLVEFEITLIVKDTEMKEFNMNFLEEIDANLFKLLSTKGFNEIKKIRIPNTDFEVINDTIHFNKNYIYYSKEYDLDNTKIDNPNINIIYDNNGAISYIEMNVPIDNLYNIEFAQKYLDIDMQDMLNMLDISRYGYLAIIKGQQKLPLKFMWRLVKLFKVPLEVLVNIPLYTKIFID